MGGRLPCPPSVSIARHLGINLARPLVDPTHQIQNPFKSLILKKLNGKGAAIAVMAIHYDFAAPVEFIELGLKLTKRHKMTIEIGNLVFVRFTNIQKEDFLSLPKPTLEMMNRNL